MNVMNYTQNGVLQKVIATKLVELIRQKPCDVSSILDIGCGTGFIAQKLIEKGFASEKILQIDANKHSLSIAQQFAKTEQVNFDLPLKFEQKFDVITSSMSLQWSENINKTISEIKKNLTQSGKFIFSIPMQGSLAEIYNALKIPHFTFVEQKNIESRLICERKYCENAFITLKNIHLCNLKLNFNDNRPQKIEKSSIAFLKNNTTNWNIGWFIVENA